MTTIKTISAHLMVPVLNLETMEEETLELFEGSQVKILIEDLSEYYYEFEYNGKIYQTSVYELY